MTPELIDLVSSKTAAPGPFDREPREFALAAKKWFAVCRAVPITIATASQRSKRDGTIPLQFARTRDLNSQLGTVMVNNEQFHPLSQIIAVTSLNIHALSRCKRRRSCQWEVDCRLGVCKFTNIDLFVTRARCCSSFHNTYNAPWFSIATNMQRQVNHADSNNNKYHKTQNNTLNGGQVQEQHFVFE